MAGLLHDYDNQIHYLKGPGCSTVAVAHYSFSTMRFELLSIIALTQPEEVFLFVPVATSY